jgi:hypothetical protein
MIRMARFDGSRMIGGKKVNFPIILQWEAGHHGHGQELASAWGNWRGLAYLYVMHGRCIMG